MKFVLPKIHDIYLPLQFIIITVPGFRKRIYARAQRVHAREIKKLLINLDSPLFPFSCLIFSLSSPCNARFTDFD